MPRRLLHRAGMECSYSASRYIRIAFVGVLVLQSELLIRIKVFSIVFEYKGKVFVFCERCDEFFKIL